MILITTDDNDFVVLNFITGAVIHKQARAPQLLAKSLDGKGRSPYRPFGIEFDDKYIYVVSNDKLAAFSRSTCYFSHMIDIPLYINTHQIIKDLDTWYTCNTAVDCIGVYLAGKHQQVNINFLNKVEAPPEPVHADTMDSRHVNSLFNTPDKIYFCRHNKTIITSDFGYIDKDTLEVKIIASGGTCCHGIRILHNQLYTLSTATGELLKIDLGTLGITRYKIVDANTTFLRGLDIHDNKLVIGASINFKNNINKRSSYVLIFDLKTGDYKKYPVPDNDCINDLKVMT